jgi:hypothetical protein
MVKSTVIGTARALIGASSTPMAITLVSDLSKVPPSVLVVRGAVTPCGRVLQVIDGYGIFLQKV